MVDRIAHQKYKAYTLRAGKPRTDRDATCVECLSSFFRSLLITAFGCSRSQALTATMLLIHSAALDHCQYCISPCFRCLSDFCELAETVQQFHAATHYVPELHHLATKHDTSSTPTNKLLSNHAALSLSLSLSLSRSRCLSPLTSPSLSFSLSLSLSLSFSLSHIHPLSLFQLRIICIVAYAVHRAIKSVFEKWFNLNGKLEIINIFLE